MVGSELRNLKKIHAALCQEFSVGAASALPLDVRRWLCPAVDVLFISWAMPLVRPLAQKSEELSSNQGRSPGINLAAVGGA